MATTCRDVTSVSEALELAKTWTAKAWWVDRNFSVYDLYGPWIEMYRGAWTPMSVAAGIAHESHGDPMAVGSDPSLGELGLWSITPGVAAKLDIDPLDPEAAIWAGAFLRNDRQRRIMEKPFYNWLADSNPHDWTALACKLPGSLGWGGWKTFMALPFPGVPAADSARRKNPHDYMIGWLEKNGHKVPKIGGMSGPCVVCRAYRSVGVDWLETVDQLHTPGEYVLVPRPEHLPHYDPKKVAKVLATPAHLREARYPEYFHLPAAAIIRPSLPPAEEPEEDTVVDLEDLAELPASPSRPGSTRPRWPRVLGGVAAGVSILGVAAAIATGRR